MLKTTSLELVIRDVVLRHFLNDLATQFCEEPSPCGKTKELKFPTINLTSIQIN
jgi:hypothetical protein